MKTIDIARRMAELGQKEDAIRAYCLVIDGDSEPAEHLEAAAYILDNGGDYQVAYTTFVQLYSAGFFRDEILPLMVKAFYEPNIRLLKNRYERNCKALAKYPYLFRKDFVPFEDLPVSFFPYDDHNGYVPFDTRTGEFRDFVNTRDPIVSRNFFRDLEKPILADDVYSQYELEYLNDSVRPSEWVGRENHIYLHYTDWAEFCSWLQVLSVKPLVESKKVVFLIGDECSEYPIDFKARFGIDYSQFSVKPVGIREVVRLIWHAQFSSDNGGDFFNEIFDFHPNLLCLPSIMYKDVEESIQNLRKDLSVVHTLDDAFRVFKSVERKDLVEELYRLRNPSDKDLFVFWFFVQGRHNWFSGVDPAARIAPVVFFQPHFFNVDYKLKIAPSGDTMLAENNSETLESSGLFRGFPYIKTFAPVRRPTTAYAATIRWMRRRFENGETRDEDGDVSITTDVFFQRILNRSFMADPQDRLFRDYRIVRFEDGKLNPKATFTALAEFLDIPCTESMTYCSERGKKDVETAKYNAIGFDTKPVYNTYDEFASFNERYLMEYFLRDAYEQYGYGFNYYDGVPMDEEKLRELLNGCTVIDGFIRDTWAVKIKNGKIHTNVELSEEEQKQARELAGPQAMENWMENVHKARLDAALALLNGGLTFVNKRGQPLVLVPWLKPDPALLDQPLYH